MAKFIRIEGAFGTVRYEEQGVLGQGLTLFCKSTGIAVGNFEINSMKELEEFATTISNAWKDHLLLKVKREGSIDGAI